jgi:2-succinyl-5-enolpyruvyl-6-hydroxy-3-cyclohexene-1-carboxylate synthase
VVLRFGATPTSKPLRAWLGSCPQIVVDPYDAWDEPTRVAETAVRAAPAPLCEALATRVEVGRDAEWIARWQDADRLVPAALDRMPDPFEPKAFNAAVAAVGDDAVVWVASSMPIRDVETFLPTSPARLSVLANRGANGIDGTVSSALGAAVATGRRVLLLIGEIALLHDVSGLLAARRLATELTIVCANNGGGGIFDFLPVADSAPAGGYERHIATPSGIDPGELAAVAGLEHRRADTPQEVAAALRNPGLIEVRSDRRENVERHRELFARVVAELDGLAVSGQQRQ